jgi:hypothetical protein
MADICSCGTGLGNTGLPNCLEELKEVRALYLVQTFDSTGARNYVNSTDTIDDAFVVDKINETDYTKRWYPLTSLEEIGGERADAIVKTSNSGTSKYVKQGNRTFTAQLWKGGSVLEANLKKGRCIEVAVYEVDASGKLVGMERDGKLYPIRVQKTTFDVKHVRATGAEPEYWNLSFQWDSREYDSELGYMEVADDCDLLSYNGLIDIVSTISGISQTGFTITLKSKFGALNGKDKLTGLLITDFFDTVGGTHSKLYNVTDSAAVTISTFSETSDGVYEFTFTSQTVADKIRVTPVKTGYDFTAVIANTVTIA